MDDFLFGLDGGTMDFFVDVGVTDMWTNFICVCQSSCMGSMGSIEKCDYVTRWYYDCKRILACKCLQAKSLITSEV